jgi:hypothetical protein
MHQVNCHIIPYRYRYRYVEILNLYGIPVTFILVQSSVADPDPGSGMEQWSDPVLFYPPDSGWSNGRIRDPG